MKVCPKCGTNYTDETLNFCLEDGAVLNRTEVTAPPEPPPTVMVQEAANTGASSGSGRVTAPVTQPQDNYTLKPRKSRLWIWALVALFGVMLICGGGIVGLIALGTLADQGDTPVAEANNASYPSPTERDQGQKVVTRDDLSGWPESLADFKELKASYRDGEFFVYTKKGLYYVITAGRSFKTANATVSLKARNPSGDSTKYGYGLVVNSDPEMVLKRDYVFVIRSDQGKYRIIEHVDQEESVVVSWTYSSAIKRGSGINELEVRSEGDQLSFYINGQFVRKITDRSGVVDGVAGIYTSDDVPIAYSDLVLKR